MPYTSRDTLSLSGLYFHFGKVDLKFGRSRPSGQWEAVGVPMTWNILKIWSISESPLKSGRLLTSSAKMQPIDHMSTPAP